MNDEQITIGDEKKLLNIHGVMLWLPSTTDLDKWYDLLSGQGEIAADIACYLTDSLKYMREISKGNQA